MVQKVPPPPSIANQDPVFNRWLLELTAILNDGGGISPDSIAGLDDAYADIAALQVTVANQSVNIAALQSQVSVLNGQVSVLNGQVSVLNGQVNALQARNQIFNGNGAPGTGLGTVGDLYLNLTGGSGTRLYGKTAAAVWTAIA